MSKKSIKIREPERIDAVRLCKRQQVTRRTEPPRQTPSMIKYSRDELSFLMKQKNAEKKMKERRNQRRLQNDTDRLYLLGDDNAELQY
jgi:hypothetical protein